MKTLGMIGGTSWYSTVEYYSLINQKAADQIGRQANPPLIIHSLNIELMRERNWEKINAKYLETARKLENAGAEGIIICANTPHKVYDYVQPELSIPILHIADATGTEAERLGLQTLGLLGNKPTMTGKFIADRLRRTFQIETIIPEGQYIDQSHHYVSKELTQGIFSDDARQFFRQQIDQLVKNGAEGIILGCTELPLLFKDHKMKVPLLATTDLHVNMAVNFILDH
ncbi:MAG: amino acid racemase [Bacteroidetes bacterium]|jgi:aspartate racemase|nr:amino acid racemase [Bacteroidota bacterium]